MKTESGRVPVAVTDATFDLWQRVAAAPPGDVDAALRSVQQWIADAIDADNVIWIGAVRVLRGAVANRDPFFGWRLRARNALNPDPEAYRRQYERYYAVDHYGRLTPGYYRRSHAGKLDHVGMTGRASLAGAGRFRVHRLRDPAFIDYAAFRKTEHYRLYFRDAGIIDRVTIGFPVAANVESFFLVDRFRRVSGRRSFAAREAALAGSALRGLPTLHRQLAFSHGLLSGDKLLSAFERQILGRLIAGETEKAIAAALDRKPTTLHKYVSTLYARLGVSSRAELGAYWLGGTPASPVQRVIRRQAS